MNATALRPKSLDAAIALFGRADAPLKDIYGLDFPPGEQQVALILRVLVAIRDGEPVVLFPGAAGTGKTTVAIVLGTVLEDCGVLFHFAAPTHKAAGRCSAALGGRWNVTTHHRIWCGSVEEVIEEGEEFASELILGTGDTKKTADFDVLLLDESSMVSDKDLANIRTVFQGTIVAMGDHHQLPPVRARYGFDWSRADEHGLTKVYRQAEGSAELDAATMIREQRVPFTFSKVANFRRGTKILKDCGVESKWLDAFEAARVLHGMLERTNGDACAIVGTHNSRVLINDHVRTLLGFPERRQGPQVGEKLVSRETCAGIPNSETCEVLSVTTQDFGDRFGPGWIVRVRTERGFKKEVAILEQQWLMIDRATNRGKTPQSIKRAMERYCDEDKAIHGLRINALVEERKTRWLNKQDDSVTAVPSWLGGLWYARGAADVGAWALYLRRFLGALDSGYAVTCHAAQGSQYEEIVVVADMVDFLAEDFETGRIDPDAVYKWSYTALTRCVKKAFVVFKARDGWPYPKPDRNVRRGSASTAWTARRSAPRGRRARRY